MDTPTRDPWRAAALIVWIAILLFGCSSAEESASDSTALPAASSSAQSGTVEQCECSPEQFCVDGVCCDTPCTGTCEACTAALKGAGVDGSCGPILAGIDPQNECTAQGAASCGFDGDCDGASACNRYPAGTPCRDVAGDCDVAEQCPGQGAACPPDVRAGASAPCSPDTNPCTLDQCDGTSPLCQHPPGNQGVVCSEAGGPCDLPEQCTGTSASCPSDVKRDAGIGCASDGNPCTLDQCDGTSVECQHPPGNAGDVCHEASPGGCDEAERCSGSSANCPANQHKPAGSPCTDDDNPCTTDQCDGSSVVCRHAVGNAGAPCRDSVGPCDARETCTGTSDTCPPDLKHPASFVCRLVADVCDVAEHCNGGDNCPVDLFAATTVDCRAPSCAAAVATLPANCPGNSAACPPPQTQSCAPGICAGNQCGGCTTNSQCPSTQFCNGGICADKKTNGQPCGEADECGTNFCADGVCCSAACNAGVCDSCVNPGSVGTCSPVAATTVCRLAAGECDQAETCGGASVCPADQKLPSGSACDDDGNPCTADRCNGTSVSCQHPAGNAGTVCRAANGSACDVADNCDGVSTLCADDKRPSTFACRSAAGECDVEEHCDGTADACPVDARKPSNTACTDDGNICSLDRCDGTSAACQHPAGNSGTTCRGVQGPCDLAETCSGSATACPADAKRPTTATCRGATGDCDLAETCDGSTDACPADAKKAAGASCTSDGNTCTVDQCNGSSNSCEYTPGNTGVTCRVSAGQCDLAEVCSGSSAACPSDAKRPNTFVCHAVAGPCDLEERCTGTGDACPNDAFRPSSFECRAASCASGVATLATNCSGSAAPCPNAMTQNCPGSLCDGNVCAGGCMTDAQCPTTRFCAAGVCVPKIVTGQPCGASNRCVSGNCVDGVCCSTPCNAGVCDSCALTGSIGTCTAVAATTVCRPAVGECDVEERCAGATSCPADANRNGQSCASDGNVCTTDVCSGTACTHNAAAATTLCRAAAGECDVAENCGGATTCPADTFRTNGTACTSDANPCTGDACENGSCAHPAANAGVVCRAAASECDDAEACTGSSPNCPANSLKANGTACSGDSNVCTRDECLIGICTHLPGNAGTACRPATGECDQAEACSGLTTACPADAFRADGAACTADTNPCTRDVCGSGVCSHPAGNLGAVCRAAAAECDAAETCTGSSATCPANASKANGTSCADDGVPCTRDQCAAGACTHPANDGATCTDGNQCTSSDTCSGGQCTGTPVQSCSCSSNTQCDDKNPCNGVETCVSGSCRQGMPLDCNDNKECTTDGCSPTTGCTHTDLPNGAPCSDGLYCTVNDSCTAGACVPGPARDCSGAASGTCQRARCDDAADACVADNLPPTEACDDQDVCTGNDRCNAGACAGQQKLGCRPCMAGDDCEDSNPCTTDLCNDLTRACEYLLVTGCIPDGGADGGGDGGDADAGDADTDASIDAGEDSPTVPTPDAQPDGPPGGDASGGGSGGGSSGPGEGNATYTKDEYGSCACRVPGSPRSGGAAAGLLLAALVLLQRCRRRRAS